MTEFMDLTSIAKLYGAKGEYSKLYDNQGRLIWQLDDPVWAGSWTIPQAGNGITGTLSYLRPMKTTANGLKLTIVVGQPNVVVVKSISFNPHNGPTIGGIQISPTIWTLSIPKQYFNSTVDGVETDTVWLDSEYTSGYQGNQAFTVAVGASQLLTMAAGVDSVPAITRIEEY